MSRVDRLLRRNKDSKSKKYFKKFFSGNGNQTTNLNFPLCPRCNARLLCGFGNKDGDWYLCLNCGEIVPINNMEGE